MKIGEIKVGETYAVDPWAAGSRGVKRIEVTGIERVEERTGYHFSGTAKTVTRRKVAGIIRAVTESGVTRTVGGRAVVEARAISCTAAEKDAADAARAGAKARVGEAVAALGAVGVKADANGLLSVTVRLSVEQAHALAGRLD